MAARRIVFYFDKFYNYEIDCEPIRFRTEISNLPDQFTSFIYVSVSWAVDQNSGHLTHVSQFSSISRTKVFLSL